MSSLAYQQQLYGLCINKKEMLSQWPSISFFVLIELLAHGLRWAKVENVVEGNDHSHDDGFAAAGGHLVAEALPLSTIAGEMNSLPGALTSF